MGVSVEEEDFADEVWVDIFDCMGEIFFCNIVIGFEFGFVFEIHTRSLSSKGYRTEIIDVHFIDLK